MRLTLICAGAMTLATLGFGVASAKAAPALVDDPMPIPAPLGTPSPLGVPNALGAPSPLGVPGSAAGSSAAGVNAANSFLQVLNGMLNKVVPGVGSIMPTDVSSLTPPGAPMSTVPALETPPAPPTPPALVPQTLAGARTFH
ncbi:hypothetical protein C5U48_23225 [Mycolicibacter virginiensis]|uniref:Uncharacterized protein n=1 Tax=Mycolicibacter virginiensis TaxID=1795032 RepID=A0A9X7NWF7_9MYCO|nr:hypothetical protein A5671_13725 [Mycolicibacter heraklionensis]OBJ33426.1 hypothetical protein A5631_06445 [Mycolicibacter heraklionensis]PQM49882.1 hypothetical protein C5U48_23225 [Mycolicibacter virginiensis]